MRRESKDIIAEVRRSVPQGVRRILVAVSGGADSVALLRLLMRADVELHAVNCNFHLRGDESDRDSEFVKALCLRFNIPLTELDFDVDKFKTEHHLSIEMACRELRYAEFRRLMRSLGCDRIATGHHRDDNVETLMLNLFRGTGIKGLAGMRVDDGEIFRPLLPFSREQILDFLADCGQGYVCDSSNLSSDYRRNLIRNEVLPLLERHWPGAVKGVARTQDNLQSDAALLADCISGALGESTMRLGGDVLTRFSDPQTVIYRFIAPHGGNGVQAREISEALAAGVYPRRWILGSGISAVLDRDGLTIEPGGSAASEVRFEEERIEVDAELMRRMKRDRSNAVLYSAVPMSELRFRHPRPGDRIAPIGMKGTSLLSDVFKDAHLTLRERAAVILAEDSRGNIIWVEGVKRSRHHLLTEGEEGYRISRVK